jgi:hypothetical protein
MFLGDEGVTYAGWDFGDKPLEIPSEGTVYVMDLPVDRVFGLDFSKAVNSTIRVACPNLHERQNPLPQLRRLAHPRE